MNWMLSKCSSKLMEIRGRHREAIKDAMIMRMYPVHSIKEKMALGKTRNRGNTKGPERRYRNRCNIDCSRLTQKLAYRRYGSSLKAIGRSLLFCFLMSIKI